MKSKKGVSTAEVSVRIPARDELFDNVPRQLFCRERIRRR